MRYLFRKMLRSVRQFKLQFASVLLLAMLSVMIFSGLEGVYNGIQTNFDKFAEETSLADEWVFASYFTPDDIAKIENRHSQRFKAAAKLMEEGKLYSSDESEVWVCLNCGFILESTQAPENCPVCGVTQGYYVRLSDDKRPFMK